MSFFVRHHLYIPAILLLGVLALSGCEESNETNKAFDSEDNDFDPQPEPDPDPDPVRISDHMLSIDVALSVGLILVEEPLMLRRESGREMRLERDEVGLFTGSISVLPGEVLSFVIPVGGGDDNTELLATIVAGIDGDEDGDDAGRVSCRVACEFGVVVPERSGEEILLSVSVFGPAVEPTKRAQ
ncbi:MAG: hypothetical protein GY854_31955 [Deltaproteobacteria bacterium]|nr:hypothetical protein [Deltaproteobacteria bacterium]